MKSFVKSSPENTKTFRHCKIVDVKEFRFTKDGQTTRASVLYVPFPFHKENKSVLRKLVNHFTEARKQYTFVVAKRTTVNKRSSYNQRIPYSRTLTAVHDSILEDLLNPGHVVGKRMRVRSDGTHLYKVFVNEQSRKVLEDRSELI